MPPTSVTRVRRIFVSYRRSDTGGHVGRLAVDLKTRFGESAVFSDTKDISAGERFHKRIEFELGRCAVILLIIGPDWVTVTEPGGTERRIDDADDVVRFEVATALSAADAQVVPVLVGGARLPKPAVLPDDLVDICELSPLSLRHDTWQADLEVLSTQIEQRLLLAKPLRSMADAIIGAKTSLLIVTALAVLAALVRRFAPIYSVENSLLVIAELLFALLIFLLGAAGRKLLPPRVLNLLKPVACVAVAVVLCAAATAYARLSPLSLEPREGRPPDGCGPNGLFTQAFEAAPIYTQGPRLCDQKTWCAEGLATAFQEIRLAPETTGSGGTLTLTVDEEHVIDLIQAPLEQRANVPDGFNENQQRPPASRTQRLVLDSTSAKPMVVRFRVAGTTNSARVNVLLAGPLGVPVQEEQRDLSLGYLVRELPACTDSPS